MFKVLKIQISPILFTLGLLFLISCGGNDNTSSKKTTNSSSGIQEDDAATEADETNEDAQNEKVNTTPIDLTNQGIGPFKDVKFSESVDDKLVEKGKTLFESKCNACHLADTRLVGPPMKDVYKRRSPAWVMNMIINPEKMLKKDLIAKALKEEYGGAIMLNLQVSEDDTKAMAEYFRTL